MKTFAVASVVALIVWLVGLDVALRKKQQRFEEERAHAAQEEEALSHGLRGHIVIADEFGQGTRYLKEAATPARNTGIPPHP